MLKEDANHSEEKSIFSTKIRLSLPEKMFHSMKDIKDSKISSIELKLNFLNKRECLISIWRKFLALMMMSRVNLSNNTLKK